MVTKLWLRDCESKSVMMKQTRGLLQKDRNYKECVAQKFELQRNIWVPHRMTSKWTLLPKDTSIEGHS